MRIQVFKNGCTSELIPNLLPWQNTIPIPDFGGDRAKYRQFHSHEKDAVCYHFSGFEGINSSMKVGYQNDAYKVNALVADWDVKGLIDIEIEKGLKRLKLPPTAYNRTFSGGMRAVWVFERPISFHSLGTWKLLVHRLAKDLNLRGAFPHLDEPLLEKPEQTYVAGLNWHVTNSTISAQKLAAHEFDAAVKASDIGVGEIEIPFDILAAEVEKRWSGRWTGAFQEGARGVRVWDASADNPTGAYLRKNGATCFTGPTPFMSWAAIFGHEFVKQYRESRTGAVLSTIYADASQSKYWVKSVGGVWRDLNTDEIKRHIKSKYQISDSPPKGRVTSELDDILDQLKMSRWVHGALPFPHRPEEVIEWAGQRFVNRAEVKLLLPAPQPGEFPWIKMALETLFPDYRNREHLIAWLKLWYESCLEGKPRRGQAIFIVGPVETGKSFLCLQVIGRIFGGHHDVRPFVVDGQGFNSEAFNKAVWCIDDAKAADGRVHARFSGIVKASVANPTMSYDKKYGFKGDCPCTSRIMVTANDDADSLSVLPDTSSSLLDKVNFYRTGNDKVPFAAKEQDRYDVVDRELPYFLRWLIDTPVPAWIEPNGRLGIKPYHDASLLMDARANSPSHNLMEVVDAWRLGQIALHREATTGEKIKAKYQPWVVEYFVSDFTRVINTDQSIRGMLPRQLYASTLGKVISKSIETGEYPWVTTRKERTGNKLVFHEIV